MSNHLDIPKDLSSLVEKREQEDRRKQDSGKAPVEERRSGQDRRWQSGDDSNSSAS